MRHDPARVTEARSWFAKAAADLRAGQVAMQAKPPLLAHAVFNAQQAVEKSMKGLLTWHDRPFRKTHNLVELGEACVGIEAQLSEILRSAAPLTEYAWRASVIPVTPVSHHWRSRWRRSKPPEWPTRRSSYACRRRSIPECADFDGEAPDGLRRVPIGLGRLTSYCALADRTVSVNG